MFVHLWSRALVFVSNNVSMDVSVVNTTGLLIHEFQNHLGSNGKNQYPHMNNSDISFNPQRHMCMRYFGGTEH